MGELAGKVIIVTGAGGGIGKEIALMVAREGGSVVVNDVGAGLRGEPGDTGAAATLVAEIRAVGGQAFASQHSVSQADSAAAIIQTAIDEFGHIDGVVNNAGILRDKLFHKMEPADFDAVIDVHLRGSFYVSNAAANYFREQGHGSYVHMTSTSGLIGNLGQANYAAAKLGIVGLSRSIAIDMERFGVRSNCIAPFAWSRMTSSIKATTPEEIARVGRLKEMGPEKVAVLACLLLTDWAGDISGQVFCVRNNEIMTMGQSRPLRSVHRSEGWTMESLKTHAIPSVRNSFYGLEKSADVLSWDPI
jgi:NAD(P)-dependent dehydrogenase (short-subunit alcohol dehydrogenase family)